MGVILFVDDDERVREVVARVLAGDGHDVLLAEDATTALKILRRPESVDLLLVDAVLPGASTGWELLARVRQCAPELPTLLTSGYSSEELCELGATAAVDLPKPFEPGQLLRLVESALHHPPFA